MKMVIPLELEYIIISFSPNVHQQLVCKDWYEEINLKHKKAVHTISKWYFKRRSIHSQINNVKEYIRDYILRTRKDDYFYRLPEFISWSLMLNSQITGSLPSTNRKISHIRNWMLSMAFSLEQWQSFGW